MIRLSSAVFLLAIAALPVGEQLFFSQHLRPEQMMAEEILLGRIWAVVSPACATLALGLLFAARLRSLKGWLALIVTSVVLFALGQYAMAL